MTGTFNSPESVWRFPDRRIQLHMSMIETPPTRQRIFTIASVSYLNAKPLLYGLDAQPDVKLLLAVPSHLLDAVRDGSADVALLPTIDYQREPGLKIVPAGGIGCDGPTLTVRIFSREPIAQIKTLACDTDSHTSVALARIILAESFRIHPEFVDLKQDSQSPARLLIGDKVVQNEPQDCPYQLDLGEAWKKLTGLPFVFAVWMARGDAQLGDLPQRLEFARLAGERHIDQIVAAHAAPRGWSADIARRYLTSNLKFAIGPAQLQAMQRFFELAAKHHVIDNARPIEIIP